MATLAINKRANYDYEITDKFEAGLSLYGYEVKSIRNGRASLKGSFVTVKGSTKAKPELYLTNTHISLYDKASTVEGSDPDRPRKILMHKREIARLVGKRKIEGLTLVPLRLYTKHNLIKLEFGIGRGKKKHDKREAIKKRDLDRQTRNALKSRL